MFIQLKKGRDGPATLACVRADGTRTWGKEHPFFPVHDLTHCAVESVLGFDQAFFGLIAKGWDIDDFAKPRASRAMPWSRNKKRHEQQHRQRVSHNANFKKGQHHSGR